MAARGDLSNRQAKEWRRKDRASGGQKNHVELGKSAGNRSAGPESQQIASAAAVTETIRNLFPSEQDQKLAILVVEGVRATSSFAEVLGIADRPIDQQREIVKKQKDRIKKVLQRKGSAHG